MTAKPFTFAAMFGITLSVVLFSTTSTIANINIKFPPGKNEISIVGRIRTAKKTCYFVKGIAGQTLSAKVSSKSGFVSIFESGDTEYEYVLDVPGKTSVCVDNLGKSTTFSLTVSIK